MIADGHLDLLVELGYRELRWGERESFARTWLPLLDAGGVRLQVCPIFVELERQPEGALREALGQATCLLRAVRENPDRVLQVRSARDLDTIEADGRIGLMLSLEGVEQFGYELWPAETFWELGMRMAGLTWNRRNPFSDGAAEDGGLSRLGRALVDEFVALGVMLHPLAIGHEQRTIARVVDHLEHALEVMGPDRVCLGGDFTTRLTEVLPPTPVPADGLMPAGLKPGQGIEGLKGPEDYPALLAALAERGWSEADVEAVTWENLTGFLRRALPAG